MSFIIGAFYIIDNKVTCLYWDGRVLVTDNKGAEVFTTRTDAKQALTKNYPKGLGIKQVEETFIMEVIKNES